METELRRTQISIHTLGTGIILFGAWSLLRALLYLWTSQGLELDGEFTAAGLVFVKVLSYFMIGLVLLGDLWLRVYIGRCAAEEARRDVRKKTYLVLSAVILLINVAATVFSLYALFTDFSDEQPTLYNVISLLLDLFSTVILAELLVTVRRIRKLRARGG